MYYLIMKIKNKKLINEYMGMIVNIVGGEDGEVGLNEFMYGMYGKVWDNSDEMVSKLKEDVLNEYGIKIGVNEENESVYIWCVDGDDE